MMIMMDGGCGEILRNEMGSECRRGESTMIELMIKDVCLSRESQGESKNVCGMTADTTFFSRMGSQT